MFSVKPETQIGKKGCHWIEEAFGNIISIRFGTYRSIKKVISLLNISKVFSFFLLYIMVYDLLFVLLNVHAILFL